MRTFNLYEFAAETEQRRLSLGGDLAPTEALRNRGGSRTPEKREALRLADARAVAAGVQPVRSFY